MGFGSYWKKGWTGNSCMYREISNTWWAEAATRAPRLARCWDCPTGSEQSRPRPRRLQRSPDGTATRGLQLCPSSGAGIWGASRRPFAVSLGLPRNGRKCGVWQGLGRTEQGRGLRNARRSSCAQNEAVRGRGEGVCALRTNPGTFCLLKSLLKCLTFCMSCCYMTRID